MAPNNLPPAHEGPQTRAEARALSAALGYRGRRVLGHAARSLAEGREVPFPLSNFWPLRESTVDAIGRAVEAVHPGYTVGRMPNYDAVQDGVTAPGIPAIVRQEQPLDPAIYS